MASQRFIHSNNLVTNAKRRKSLLLSGLTPGVKARGMAFTLIELLIVVAVALLYGGWVVQECAKLSAPLDTGPSSCYGSGFVGVGIQIEKDHKSTAVRISKIIPNSPAALVNLSPGLVIQKIDGVTTYGKDLTECQICLRGKAGTKVRLELVNSDGNETNVIELTRQALKTSKTT